MAYRAFILAALVTIMGACSSIGAECSLGPVADLQFDRTCATSNDCVLKFHYINCCGSLAAVGINTSDSTAFDEAESQCMPQCECAAGPTVADDGKTAMELGSFTVACVSNRCLTSAP